MRLFTVVFALLICASLSPHRARAGYPADDTNYLCKNVSKPWRLPCVPNTLDHYQWRMKGEFPITGWWPPMNDYEIKGFAGANFNLILLQPNTQEPPLTMSQQWEYIVGHYNTAADSGLYSIITPLFYNVKGPGTAWGGREGGITSGSVGFVQSYVHESSVPEMQFMAEYITNYSMDKVVGIQIADDTNDLRGYYIDEAEYLHGRSPPDIIPYVNQAVQQPEWLANAGIPFFAPELYFIACGPQGLNCTTLELDQRAANQARSFKLGSQSSQRYNLSFMPLFQTGCGAPVDNLIQGDSVLRFYVYSALANGAKALHYFCFGGSVWDLDQNQPNPVVYPVVKAANADALVWGKMLLESRLLETLHNSWDYIRPGPNNVVSQMPDDLLVGLLWDPSSTNELFVMVSDTRLDVHPGGVAPRNVTIVFASSVLQVEIIPGAPASENPFHDDEGFPHYMRVHRQRRGQQRAGAVTVTLQVAGGGGQLLRVTGSPQMIADARALQPWSFNPNAAGLNYATGDSYQYYTFDYNAVRTNMVLAADFRTAAGSESADVERFTRAFVNMLVSPADSAVLEAARKYGVFVSDTGSMSQPSSLGICNTSAPSVRSVDSLASLIAQYGCHPNLAGAALGYGVTNKSTANATGIAAVVAVSDWLRHSAPYRLPLVVSCSLDSAEMLSSMNVPIVSLPTPPPFAKALPAEQRAQATLKQYAETAALSNVTVMPYIDCAFSMSDSVLRFQSFAALAYGARGLWLQDMSSLVPDVFELMAGLFRRVTQWGDTLLDPDLSLQGLYYSEGSWAVPGASPLPVAPARVGGNALVQALDPDVMLAVFQSSNPDTTPWLLVIDKRVSDVPSSQAPRTLRVYTNSSVLGFHPVEGSCQAGFCTCTDRMRVGSTIAVVLPGGSAQLVGLQMIAWNATAPSSYDTYP